MPGLSADAGVHHALYAGTEWDHRTVLPQSQRRVCLAARVSDVRGRATRHSSVAAVVQPGAPASGLGLSEPDPISDATSNPGGLISGEHYNRADLSAVALRPGLCRLRRLVYHPVDPLGMAGRSRGAGLV